MVRRQLVTLNEIERDFLSACNDASPFGCVVPNGTNSDAALNLEAMKLTRKATTHAFEITSRGKTVLAATPALLPQDGKVE